MDISQLDLAALRALAQKIQLEIRHRQNQDLARAREQILRIAQSVGIPLKDLIGSAPQKKQSPAKGTKVAAQFRHPQHEGLQWTGRGRPPEWIKKWLKDGNTLDALRNGASSSS